MSISAETEKMASTPKPNGRQPSYLDEKFDELFQKMMVEWKICGASLGVVDGHDIYAKGYGLDGPNGPKITEHTLFNTASMSKSFTAAAVALIVDDTKYPQVQWDSKVSDLMREDFVLADPAYTENVTITDMLCHRTGLPRHDDIIFGLNSPQPSTAKSITRSLRYLPITKPLRYKWQYQNLIYTAASYLVEVVTGRSFSEVLKSRFWDPLGMKRTFLGLEKVPDNAYDDLNGNASTTHGWYWDKEKEAFLQTPDFNGPDGQGAGNIMSSAQEWARWLYAMIHKTSAISEKSLEQLTTPLMPSSYDEGDEKRAPFQSPLFYGMGWHVEYYRGHTIISHGGSIPGYTSQMYWLPERQWGAVIFGNTDGVSEAGSILIWTLIDEILGVPKEERPDWAQMQRDQLESENDEEDSLFPDRPDELLPMQLPLSAYAGLYTNPGYRELRVEVRDGKLVADATDRTFPFTLTFEHVSSDYFKAVRKDEPKYSDYIASMESAFEVGVDGKVKRMGIDFINEDDSEYIWFDRKD